MSIHGSPLILRVAIDAVRGNKYSARADSLHVLPVFCDSYVRLEFDDNCLQNIYHYAILTDDSVIIVLKMLIQRVEKSIWQNSIRFLRNNKKWIPGPEPETFENVVFPPNGEYKLPAMPEEPTYDPALGEQKFKTSKQLVSIRGFEEIHTTLIHKQYGLVAVTGGFISAYDFNFIRERLNRNLLKDQFAIWRVPAPWLPRTKKATGAKPGSGKGNIHHYVTPVRAKRIILEVGGYIMELEARAYLMYLCERFRFPVEFVSEKILKEKELQEKKIEELNVNKFNWDLALKYNMQNCRKCNGSQMALVGEEELLHCSFRWFITISASLPVSALFLCISLALTLHFDESTETHCDVTNYLPSISAAIASYSPERYIWRFLIALQSAPRIVIALAFRNFLLTSPLRPLNDRAWFGLACQIACVINVAESLFLLLLTTVSSSENHAVHTTSFTGFAVCSIIYMLISTALFQYSGRRRTSSLGEKSFQYKVLMCSISVLSLLIAIYFFNRHNTFYSIIVMVFFSCDKCGEALKKNQVDKHGFKCRNTTYSCLDCGQAFSLETYKNHIKCVTENKKYGGKNYVEKENKGEAKQNRWIEQVERAIENVTDKELKDLLQQIRGFNNIPRKETKFINFLQNSIKIRNRDLCIKAWNCISEQARKMQQEAEKIESKKSDGGCNNVDNSKKLNCKQETSKNNGEKVEEIGTEKKKVKENIICENGNKSTEQKTLRMDDEKKFKWKRTIKRALKEAEDGQMKIKRLKAKVIQSYLASGQSNGNDENPEIIFNAKLYSLEGEIKNMEVAVSAEVAWCPNTYDEPISSSLFGLCIRYFALQHDEIKDLPQFIAQRIQILQYDMDIARRMYEGHVTFKLSWIFVGKDGYMDWPKTYAKCFREMPADEFFIFAAINGIATKAFWQRMDESEKQTYHGWPGALCAWIGIRNNHLNNVNYQEELVGDNLELSRLETSTASSLNYTEFAILLAIRNGQYHMLRYLPTISNQLHKLCLLGCQISKFNVYYEKWKKMAM
ncbi:Post-GPI attachment to proteins factor [Dirofilaria immitis]